ncbi:MULTISPECIES: DUF4142 domain-containing protein [unclassified Streptomyces]|uniref:DUF4142 domain-containing protein n=1 Tax=unclassified Streptomyces TaxID=2593676 RepID=UPI00333321FC
MPSNRRAASSGLPLRTLGIIIAACAVVATLLIVTRGGDEEAAADPVSAGVPQHAGVHDAGADAPVEGAAPEDQALTEVDKTFLVKVRQAGLWEIPAGKLAQTHASSESVKRAGLHLIDGHSKLDQLVREDARILGVALPDEATAEQQGFVRQMENARGAEFDRIFANLLRASHGKIFATIAEVRAGTQNDLIRRHARQANQTVLDHLEVLEDTGFVDSATFQEVEAAVKPK